MLPLKVLTCCCYLILSCCSEILNEIGRLYIPNVGRYSAESVAITINTETLYVTDSENIGLHVISFNISNDLFNANLYYKDMIDLSSIFEDFDIWNKTVFDITWTKYSFKNDLILVTIVPTNYALFNGYLALINPSNLTILDVINLTQCFFPHHVTITNNGNTILIACQGEADNNTISNPQYNPPGSVTLIDMDNNINIETWNITNIGFTDFDENGTKHDLLPNDIYTPYMDKSFSINAEPQYIDCSDDDMFCYVTLQENNAVAILDMNKREMVSIYSLGTNDYSVHGLDASDVDNGINITRYARLYGLRMPDNINYFKSTENRHYILTANEGDSKQFDESRVAQLILDQNTFIGVNVADLIKDENLGRLNVINQLGTHQKNGIYQELYTFSSRDFTIWEVNHANNEEIPTLSFVYSNNAEFETITAVILGRDGFNSDGYVPSFDTRSDDKGPEPEGIVTAKCSNGRSYTFIGLQRVGGIFVYEITNLDDGEIQYVEYINNRNFSIHYGDDVRPPEISGDVGPEQLIVIDEAIYGAPLLIVTNEQSSSVTMYRIDCEEIFLSKHGTELEVWEVALIVIASIIAGIIYLLIILRILNKKYPHNQQIGEDKQQKTYSQIDTEDVDGNDIDTNTTQQVR